MKIKEFFYDKGDGVAKKRYLLVQNESPTFLEGLDLQDLSPEAIYELELDLADLEHDYKDAIAALIQSYDLNMFKRFLKSKIAP